MINYEPPQPLAPGVSAAFGAANQYSRDLPEIQRARQFNAQQQLQAGIAGASAFNQGRGITNQRDIATGEQELRAGMQQQNEAFQFQENNQRFAQAAAIQYAQQEQAAAQQRAHEEQQQRLQQQHYEQTVAARYQEMTQGEQLRLQRLREADTWVDEQPLDPEVKLGLKANIRGLRGPLEFKAAQTQQKLAEAHAQMHEQQAMKEKEIQLRAATIEAKSIEDRTVRIPDAAAMAEVLAEMGPFNPGAAGVLGPQAAKQIYDAEVRKRIAARGGMATFIMGTDGKLTEVKHEKTAKNTRADGLPADAMTNSAFTSMMNQEKQRVDSYVNGFKKESPETFAAWSQEMKSEKLAHDVRMRLGMPKDESWDIPPTYEEYEAWKRYSATKPVPKSQPFSFPGAQGPSTANPSPAAAGTTPNAAVGAQDRMPTFLDASEQKPFSQKDVGTPKITPQQEEAVRGWHTYHNMIGKSDLPPEQKQDLQSQINWAIHVMERYGSIENAMKQDPQAAQQYVAVMKRLDAMEKAGDGKKAAALQTPSRLTPFADPIGTLNSAGVIKDGKLNIRVPQSFGNPFGY